MWCFLRPGLVLFQFVAIVRRLRPIVFNNVSLFAVAHEQLMQICSIARSFSKIDGRFEGKL